MIVPNYHYIVTVGDRVRSFKATEMNLAEAFYRSQRNQGRSPILKRCHGSAPEPKKGPGK